MKWGYRVLILGYCGALLFTAGMIRAATTAELEQKISSHTQELQALEQEIAGYEKELTAVGKEKQTLQSAIALLDISRKKLGADIKVTENRIATTELRINETEIEIEAKKDNIATVHEAVGETVRTLAAIDRDSPIEMLLRGTTLSDTWDHVVALNRLGQVLEERRVSLVTLKQNYEKKKTELETRKKELVGLRAELENQKRALDSNRQEKAALLAATQNKESNYKKILDAKVAQRVQFEQELLAYESELRLSINPNLLPATGRGILRWPLDAVFVTQYFGNTEFATRNPQIYSGKGHNGVDLRAAPGTKVRAAGSGTVIGVGNTDPVCPNASYGKWILLRHHNGLSTIYAHLTLATVTAGQSVGAGEIIGYSGQSGYALGPHLHFSVLATQGVQIAQIPSRVYACTGRIYTVPVADPRAYLNPLSYL